MKPELACTFLLMFVLTGCSNLYKSTNKNETNIAGAGDLFKENSPFSSLTSADQEDGFTELNYCDLIKQHSQGKTSEVECAIPETLSVAEYTKARNEIQDYVIAASNQKCGHYMRVLYGHRGDTEVFWGGLSALLAGAGAVLTNVQSAQAMSAGAAVSSGIRSELSQAYFANLAMEVVTAGINARRDEIFDQIQERRKQNMGNITYTIHGAVSDALTYHSSCSVLIGLEVASQSINRVSNPGVKDFLQNYDQLKEKFGLGKPESQ